MAKRKAFMLRIDPDLYIALKRWADADLRSVNGQVEFLLRRAVRDAGRGRVAELDPDPEPPDDGAPSDPADAT